MDRSIDTNNELAGLPPLAFELDHYFIRAEGSLEIELNEIKPIRRRPEGVANAYRLMRLAFEGKQTRRAPINVIREGEGYRIQDGNSTYAVAEHSQWPRILCLVQESEH